MSSNPSNPWYFEYHDYIKVKNIFKYTPRDVFDVRVANDLIRDIQNTRKKELNLHKTFYDLKKMVQRFPCFYEHGRETCCKYINYWLNKTVRDSKYNVNDENFNIFDKFMQVDSKIQDSGLNCISKLSYMKKDVFEKTEKLYDLYDYFTELKESKDPTALCKNISVLTQMYESVFQECKEKDNNLCNKLTNLKSVIVKDELVANNICTKTAFDSFISKIYPPLRKVQNMPRKVQVQGRYSGRTHTPPPVPVSSPQTQGIKSGKTHITRPASVSLSRSQGLETQAQELEKQAQELEKQAGGESEQTLSVPQEQFPRPLPQPLPLLPLGQLGQLESSDDTSEPTGPKEPYEMPKLASELGQGQLQEHGPRFSPERPEWLKGPVQPQGHDVDQFSEDEMDIFPEEGGPSAGPTMPTFDTGTIIGTIKDAVSNVLEAVEPVPILGVSGGMGALYLLFKYTPIGSLFRRNRRNNQNIPNFFDPRYGEQFSGYYPQYYNEGFPNYRMNIAYYPSSEELD
ncbi:PIR protein [Plasmodium vivax]|nr:PIR protein [Plasmodium vivax]